MKNYKTTPELVSDLKEMSAEALCVMVENDFFPDNHKDSTVSIATVEIDTGDPDWPSIVNVAFYLGDRDMDDGSVYELNNLAFIQVDGDFIN